MISTGKSTLETECHRHYANILNEVVVPRISTVNLVERLRTLPPFPTTTPTTSGRHGNCFHPSINHLSRGISEDTPIVFSSVHSRQFMSNSVTPANTTGIEISPSNSGQHDDRLHGNDSSGTGNEKYYNEGTYLYATDMMTTMHNTGIGLSISTTTIGSEISQSYATAQSHVRAGNFSDAIRYFEIALTLVQKEQIKNGTSANVIPLMQHFIYHNMGHCYYCIGQNGIAMTFYQLSLQVAVDTKLDNYIYIAAAQNAIAALQLHEHEQEQYREQTHQKSCGKIDVPIMTSIVSILQQCHEVYVTTFGLYSKEAATILYNIGRASASACQYESAKQSFEQCLQIRQNAFSMNINCDGYTNNTDLMDAAICIFKMGQIYHQTGKYNAAIESYQQFLHMLRSNNNMYHQDVARTILYMADISTLKGRVNEAIANYEHIIEYRSLYFGAVNDENVAHDILATAHTKLGDIRTKKREYGTALNHYLKSLGRKHDFLLMQPLHHHHQEQYQPSNYILVTMCKIADVQRKMKLHCSAIQIYMRLYDLQIVKHGPHSLEVGRILSQIGSTLYDDQKYSLAIEFFLDAFKVQMIYHSFQDTVEAATTLNSIGLIYFLRQQYSSAEFCFTESLRMNITVLGYDHYDNSILWYNIASTNYEQGLHDKAITFYEAAIRIESLQSSERAREVTDNAAMNEADDMTVDDGQRRAISSKRRSNNTRSLQKLGSIYEKQAELQKAKESYLQALRIELSLQCQQNIPTIARLLNVIGNIFLQEANIKPMMECYTTAARLLQHHKLNTDMSCDGMDTVQTGRSNSNDCALIITGYKYYYLSRMHPPAAATA